MGGAKIEDIALAEENLAQAESNLYIQELLVDQAEENLSKTKLYASFDGQISSVNFKEGEFIASGQNIMTSDAKTTEMTIIASEAEFVEMEEGMYGIVALDSKPEFPLYYK